MIDTFSPNMILGPKQMDDEGYHSTMPAAGGCHHQGDQTLAASCSSVSSSTSRTLGTSNKKKLVLQVGHWSLQQQEGFGLPVPSPKKNVTFAPTCKVKFGLPLADYTKDEITACWYTQEEVTDRRRKSLQIVFKLRLGEGGRYCVRGLESLVPEVAAQRAQRRRQACYTVLREQYNQQLTELYNPEAIARKYRNVSSRESQIAAYRIGHEDEVASIKANIQGTGRWQQILRRQHTK